MVVWFTCVDLKRGTLCVSLTFERRQITFWLCAVLGTVVTGIALEQGELTYKGGKGRADLLKEVASMLLKDKQNHFGKGGPAG